MYYFSVYVINKSNAWTGSVNVMAILYRSTTMSYVNNYRAIHGYLVCLSLKHI